MILRFSLGPALLHSYGCLKPLRKNCFDFFPPWRFAHSFSAAGSECPKCAIIPYHTNVVLFPPQKNRKGESLGAQAKFWVVLTLHFRFLTTNQIHQTGFHVTDSRSYHLCTKLSSVISSFCQLCLSIAIC